MMRGAGWNRLVRCHAGRQAYCLTVCMSAQIPPDPELRICRCLTAKDVGKVLMFLR
jgi:hypothetical protein